jgi:ADP-ribose pyrophosphatase
MNRKSQKRGQVFSRKVVHKNPWFRIVKEKIQKPSGFRGNHYIFEGNSLRDFVVIVVRDEQENFYLVKQWRPALKRYLVEFAAGGTGRGESYLQAAKREVREELRLEAKRWDYLGKAAVAPGFSREYGRFFLATGVKPTQRGSKGEPGEVIEIVKISRKKFEKMVSEREIEDGPTLTAYMLYVTRRKDR